MNRRFIPLVVLAVAIVVLSLFVQDFVRDVIVIPLIYVGWFAWLMISNLPQWVFWIALIGAATVIALRSVKGAPATTRRRVSDLTPPRGPVTQWTERLINANSQETSKWRVARDLGRLYWETRFPDEPYHMQQFVAQVSSDSSQMPAEIRDYFLAGLARPHPTIRSRLHWGRRPPSPLDLDPTTVVGFLEHSTALSEEDA